MISGIIKFWGKNSDENSEDIKIHAYYLASSPWQNEASGICSVMPLTNDTPSLSKHHKISDVGGEEEALKLMIEDLTKMPENQGLRFQMDRKN